MAEIQEAGGEVVAISVESAEETRDALGSSGISYPLLADPDLKTIDAYGLRHSDGGLGGIDVARPATFIIDRDGRIAWKDLTDNWRIRLRAQRVLDELVKVP